MSDAHGLQGHLDPCSGAAPPHELTGRHHRMDSPAATTAWTQRPPPPHGLNEHNRCIDLERQPPPHGLNGSLRRLDLEEWKEKNRGEWIHSRWLPDREMERGRRREEGKGIRLGEPNAGARSGWLHPADFVG